MASYHSSMLSILDNQSSLCEQQQLNREDQLEETKNSDREHAKVVNIFKEKLSGDSSEPHCESREDRKKKVTTVKLKHQSVAASSEEDGMIIIIEDPSVHSASNAMHSYSKHSKTTAAKLNRNSSRQEKMVGSMKKLVNIKKQQDESSTSGTANLVEQVACYKCKFCLFLSLSQDAVSHHVQQEHSNNLPEENNVSMQCPGCNNVFYSQKSLQVHLSEDHNVAKEELDSILSSFENIDNVVSQTPIILKRSSNRRKPLENHRNGAECSHESPYLGPESQNYIVEDISSNVEELDDSNEETTEISIVEKRKTEQQCVAEPSPSDETGKIRVRKLSTLENSKKGSRNDEVAEVFPQILCQTDSDIRVETSSASYTYSANGSQPQSPDIRLNESHSDVSNDDVQMDIQYDIDTIEILDMPLEEEQGEPQEQLIQELNLEQSGNGRNLQPIRLPISCEEIIDGICEDAVLDKVLYIERGRLNNEQDLACLSSLPSNDSGNEEGYHAQVKTVGFQGESLERIILSSCTLDGSSLVGANGKKLVKRGYVQKPMPLNKVQGRKRKIVRTTRKKRSDTTAEERYLGGNKCPVPGCLVRLHCYDKLQYHQQCHVMSETPDNISADVEDTEGNSKRALPGQNKFSCPECSVEFKMWKQLKTHLWKSHSIDMELFTCDHCGYKTASLFNLKNAHEKIHGSEKPHLCDTCGKGFKTIKQLQNHKGIHGRGVEEICETCGRSFNSSRMLRSHINTVHNKVRPYMCSECGHTAANRSSLKMHLRQHTGDRPYSCDQCDYTTADHNSLRRHKKRHTGDKPYKCPYCTYACIQSTTYKIHLRTKHPGQDNGLTFSCKKCSFNSVSRDIFLAHNAEHELAEACGVPFKPSNHSSFRRSAKYRKVADENTPEDLPIFVSLASDDTTSECESSNFESIVHHVSEAIVPGTNFHVLYNSISLSTDSSAQKNHGNTIVEMPSEELEFKLRDEKTET